MRNRHLFQAAVAVATGLGLFAPAPVLASDTFTYREQEDFLAPGSATRTTVESGNTRNVLNAINLVNTGSETIKDLIYLTPFLWVATEQKGVLGLEWENDLSGWTTSDYDGLGNSLTLRLNNPDGEVRLGDLADVTGKAPTPLTVPCDFSPSCITELLPGVPPLSQDADDVLPFISVGDLAPGEEIALDVSLSYDFEDGRIGSLPTLPAFGTFLPTTTQEVPEPASILALVGVSGVLLVSKRKQNADQA